MTTPRVTDQALPSEVQSTAGSEWKASGAVKGRKLCPQVAPPSEENITTRRPLPAMLFAALRICCGFKKLMRMSDSLRGLVATPDMRRSPPDLAALVSPPVLPTGGVLRFWWVIIHSWISFKTSG